MYTTFAEPVNSLYLSRNPSKGQLISKCPFVVFKSPKNPSKKFPGFLPYPLKRGQINKVV